MAAIHGRYRNDRHFFYASEYLSLSHTRQFVSSISFYRPPIRALNTIRVSLTGSRALVVGSVWSRAKFYLPWRNEKFGNREISSWQDQICEAEAEYNTNAKCDKERPTTTYAKHPWKMTTWRCASGRQHTPPRQPVSHILRDDLHHGISCCFKLTYSV